jgi:hypothetical protein
MYIERYKVAYCSFFYAYAYLTDMLLSTELDMGVDPLFLLLLKNKSMKINSGPFL